MFRCFLSEAFAEENLFFVDELDSLRKEKSDAKIREGIAHLIEIYGQIINLSSVAMNVSY
jgi:hypothetical protein